MNTAIRHEVAAQAARRHLQQHPPDVVVEPHGEAGWHHARAATALPDDPSERIARGASSPTKTGAIELARSELYTALHSYFLAADQAKRMNLRAWEAHVFTHGEPASVRRVQCAGRARGVDADVRDVGLAYIAVGGNQEVTVGDVVAQLLERRGMHDESQLQLGAAR